eukprot:471038-Amphidinium_carterae.2
MDCRRSGVNAKAVQSQRIILPSPQDVAGDAPHLHATAQQYGLAGSLEAVGGHQGRLPPDSLAPTKVETRSGCTCVA